MHTAELASLREGHVLNRKSILPGAFISVLLAVFIGWAHEKTVALVERESPPHPENQLPSAEAVQLCALGYDQLLADWYWLGFVQYVGDIPAREADHYVFAEKYLDLITGLDPKFAKAYYFAAFIVGS